MSRREVSLYRTLVRGRNAIVEFGAGASTMLAIKHSLAQIYSVDSSKDCIDQLLKFRAVRLAIAQRRLYLHHADIGPVRHWGKPLISPSYENAACYYSAIWDKFDNRTIDLVLIDGRFRVACIIETLRHSPTTTIAIHDFWNRPHYQVVLPALSCIERVDTMGVFVAAPDLSAEFLDGEFARARLDTRMIDARFKHSGHRHIENVRNPWAMGSRPLIAIRPLRPTRGRCNAAPTLTNVRAVLRSGLYRLSALPNRGMHVRFGSDSEVTAARGISEFL
jgi:hypothetical protein